MSIALPDDLADALQPLFDVLPPDEAMTRLVVTEPGPDDALEAVEDLIQEHDWHARQALCAGLYLYIDQLERSHRLSQQMEDDATGCYWHGIMHRREGDFGNSQYWFRRAGKHPAMAQVGDDYNGFELARQVESATRAGQGAAAALDALIDLHRREWAALMAWCWKHGR
jgi:hypothetical protein